MERDDAPQLGLHRQEYRKARKQHTCSLCGQPIMPGEHYWRSFMVVDGEPESMKSHTKGTDCLSYAWPSSDASSDASDPPAPGSS